MGTSWTLRLGTRWTRLDNWTKRKTAWTKGLGGQGVKASRCQCFLTSFRDFPSVSQVQELLARPLTDSPPINVNQELGIEGDNDGSNSASAGPQRAAQAKNQKQTSSSSKDPGERQPHGAEEDTASLNEEAEAIVAQALQEDDADSDRPPAPSGEAL